MKKLFLVLLFSSLISVSCSKKQTEAKLVQIESSVAPKIEKFEAPESAVKFDYDFDKLNYNMASSLVFDFLINPQEYENKTLNITGTFNTDMYEGIRYYSVFIWDQTKCCPTGVSFIPPATMKYPEDFGPENGSLNIKGTLKQMTLGTNEGLFLIAENINVIK